MRDTHYFERLREQATRRARRCMDIYERRFALSNGGEPLARSVRRIDWLIAARRAEWVAA